MDSGRQGPDGKAAVGKANGGAAGVAAPAGGRPGKRKRGKRKTKAKLRRQALPAETGGEAVADSSAPSKSSDRQESPSEAVVVTPAFLARGAEQKATGQAPQLAAVASADSVPADAQRVTAPEKRAAADSEDSDHGGHQWPWILLLCILALGGFGYWKWQDRVPELWQTAGDWTKARIEELALSLDLIPAPPEEVAPAAGSAPAAADAAAQTAAKPKLEEIVLPTPPPLLLAQVVELETLLQRLGFDPGKIDGEVDEQTRAAIRQFQEWDGQDVDGEPSRALLQALREVAGYQGSGG